MGIAGHIYNVKSSGIGVLSGLHLELLSILLIGQVVEPVRVVTTWAI